MLVQGIIVAVLYMSAFIVCNNTHSDGVGHGHGNSSHESLFLRCGKALGNQVNDTTERLQLKVEYYATLMITWKSNLG